MSNALIGLRFGKFSVNARGDHSSSLDVGFVSAHSFTAIGAKMALNGQHDFLIKGDYAKPPRNVREALEGTFGMPMAALSIQAQHMFRSIDAKLARSGLALSCLDTTIPLEGPYRSAPPHLLPGLRIGELVPRPGSGYGLFALLDPDGQAGLIFRSEDRPFALPGQPARFSVTRWESNWGKPAATRLKSLLASEVQASLAALLLAARNRLPHQLSV